MKLGMHESLLILKEFVKNKLKPTKETRYMICHCNTIMGTQSSPKNTIFSKHVFEEINLISNCKLSQKSLETSW